MRIRAGLVAVMLAAALTACSDESDGDADSGESPSAPLTEITVDCDQFADTTKKISDAQAALYTGTGDPETIETLVAELDALKDGAPADIQDALTDMGAAFRAAAEILENPTRKKKAELEDLAPKLSQDGQKITDYILSECR